MISVSVPLPPGSPPRYTASSPYSWSNFSCLVTCLSFSLDFEFCEGKGLRRNCVWVSSTVSGRHPVLVKGMNGGPPYHKSPTPVADWQHWKEKMKTTLASSYRLSVGNIPEVKNQILPWFGNILLPSLYLGPPPHLMIVPGFLIREKASCIYWFKCAASPGRFWV